MHLNLRLTNASFELRAYTHVYRGEGRVIHTHPTTSNLRISITSIQF